MVCRYTILHVRCHATPKIQTRNRQNIRIRHTENKCKINMTWTPISNRRGSFDRSEHQVHIGLQPSYLRECVTASADVTSRPRLRSTSSQRYERPRMRLKFGERSFSSARPRALNSLPSSLQELTDAKTFRRKLKTFLFQQAYN